LTGREKRVSNARSGVSTAIYVFIPRERQGLKSVGTKMHRNIKLFKIMSEVV